MKPTRILALAPVLFALTLARGAGATSSFPAAIQSNLALAHPPACALCHTTGDSGGRGTVNTPFGTTIRGRGLVAYDEAGLKSALAAMAAEKTDSDQDCVPDIDELKQGSDPNTANGSGMKCAGPAAPQGDTPQYGCGAHVSPLVPTSTGAFPFAAALAAAIALLRRRSRGAGR